MYDEYAGRSARFCLFFGVSLRGEVHYALEEAESLQDLSTWLNNRGNSEAEIDMQVKAFGVHPVNDSQAALPLVKVQSNFHGSVAWRI